MLKRCFLGCFSLLFSLWLSPVSSALFSSSHCDEPPLDTYAIVSEPLKFKGKKVILEGEFYSFSTLALDYKAAFRPSKDFVAIVLARPDHPKIPLVELKIAVPIRMFKEDESLSSLEHGDIIRLEAKVFAVALGEAWLDVSELKIKTKITKNEDDETSEEE